MNKKNEKDRKNSPPVSVEFTLAIAIPLSFVIRAFVFVRDRASESDDVIATPMMHQVVQILLSHDVTSIQNN